MSVIAIDTASRSRAWVVRTTEDGAVLERRELPGGELDRALPGSLAELLREDVAAVVVLTGPGSYSGVRAGMAAALGVAAARRLPLHGLGSLAAVAGAAGVADGTVVSAAADAGRGGVYIAQFACRGGLVEQLAPVQRMTAGEVDIRQRVFATAAIPGLDTEWLDPCDVLAGAVPRALASPPLAPLGLRAIHVEPAGNGPPTRGGRTAEAL